MTESSARNVRGLAPMLLGSVVVVLLCLGQAQGYWLSNLHNALLGLAFTLVGGYVLFQRPGHLEGRLFMATGVVEAVLFLGRQLGHFPSPGRSAWWGWFGVWPTVIALALTTMSVFRFPDGRLPARWWRWVEVVVISLAAAGATVSAWWPVEYSSTGVRTPPPVSTEATGVIPEVWSALAHPAYASFQVLWVLAIMLRWRGADITIRRQLKWLVGSAALSVTALLVGLAVAQSPRAGLLTATLVPVAAGWAIVHGQHVTAYSALSWLSRADADPVERPAELARAVAEALSAPSATLWMGNDELHAVGVWPDSGAAITTTTRADLEGSTREHTRTVISRGVPVGALSVGRSADDELSLAEARLFRDLASHASLVIDHLGLADVIARQRRAGRLDGLSKREHEVLELMALGRSNAAICEELHLSIKTVEPIVSTIFGKLELHHDASTNRRVLAVLAYMRT